MNQMSVLIWKSKINAIITFLLVLIAFSRVAAQASLPALLAVGTTAPAWTLVNSENKKIELSDYKGKVVVMDFWATWCAPCVKAQPKLQSIHEKYKDVIVLGMDFNDNENMDLNTYKARKKLTYEIVRNAERIASAYKVKVLPTVYVIDRSGKIVHTAIGYSEKEEAALMDAIEKAILK